MSGFYRRALSKSSLTEAQYRELLVSASGEIFRLKAVLDSLPSGILVCDEKHSLVIANKSALRLLPLSQTEGDLLWELVLDGDLASFFKKTLQNGDRVLEHEEDVAVRGHNRLLSISVHPLVDRRQISGSLVHVEDITEKRAREVRLRRAENLASLTTLAAGVAHEIKNPLGAISIHLQLMQKAINADEYATGSINLDGLGGEKSGQTEALLNKYFDILNEEVDRLNHIVVDFLFAVRPMTLELREGNLNLIIHELAEFVNAELEQSNIRLLLELDENLLPVLVDERYIKQMLLNLVRNAQAAMPNGGLLTIATIAKDSEARLNICDTGIGISQENIGKIFEPYFTTKDNGTGLGLTIVYKIVREHRGEILVDSREGGGTHFEIILPVHWKEQRLLSYKTSA
ncbi:MAG: ATP-binding protein [Treponema sp.]|nr:ATP-binding protein [Treponema sp.]